MKVSKEQADKADPVFKQSHACGCSLPLVCPLCHVPLKFEENRIECPAQTHQDCPGSFDYCNGFPDLIIGERFEDDHDPDQMAYEEACNVYSAMNYWVPLFRKLLPQGGKILSVGCGVGTEVEIIVKDGFNCVGIDCGNRTDYWPRRECRDSMLLANGLFLPFEDDSFDLVFCGCVFAHIGVVGDSFVVTDHFERDRQQLADEMVRVTRRKGSIIVASPNRHFPLDLFHRGDEAVGNYNFRINKPGDRFLLSAGDFRQLFVKNSGCESLELLPVEGFWGFIRANNGWKGRLFGTPVKFVFKLLAHPWFSFLRGSVIDPWITIRVTK